MEGSEGFTAVQLDQLELLVNKIVGSTFHSREYIWEMAKAIDEARVAREQQAERSPRDRGFNPNYGDQSWRASRGEPFGEYTATNGPTAFNYARAEESVRSAWARSEEAVREQAERQEKARQERQRGSWAQYANTIPNVADFKTLGIPPNSSWVDVKKQYRKLIKQFHPDTNPDGEAKSREINAAYQRLEERLSK